MFEYRCYIKDCLKLNEMAKAETICFSFDTNRDILEGATSTFNVETVADNVNEGDLLMLVDPYGTIIYKGIIKSTELNKITTTQEESLFADKWLYSRGTMVDTGEKDEDDKPIYEPSETTIEEAIKTILERDFKNADDPIMQAKFNFNISVGSQTEGKLPTESDHYTISFEKFIYSLYDNYGIRLYIDIPYSSGECSIEIANKEFPSMKIANNTRIITSITPTTEIDSRNKLVIYNKDGTELRETYYVGSNGITTNAEDPTRLPVINTDYVFTDDELEDIVKDKLNEEMYNHLIEYEIVVDNKLYDFYSMNLSMPIEVWYNGFYYDSVFTGYSFSKTESEGIRTATIKCGKVRNELTSKLFKLLGGENDW